MLDIEKLRKNLTEKQFFELVTNAFSTFSREQWMKAADCVDSEILYVVKGLLEKKHVKQSNAKIRQKWDQLIRKINMVVDSLGDDEDGYLEGWHHDQFDETAFGVDLDSAIKGILKLVPEIEDAVDFFADLVERIDSGIDSYPSYMYVQDSVVDFCPELTHALLLAYWQVNDKVEYFVEEICEIKSKYVHFSDEGFADFTETLGDKAKNELFSAIVSLNAHNENKGFKAVFRALAPELSPDEYYQHLMDSIPQEWWKARELIEKFEDENNYQFVIKAAKKAICTLLNRDSVNPEKILFAPNFPHWSGVLRSENLPGIINSWSKASAKLGDEKLAGILGFQKVVIENPSSWCAVSAVYKKFQQIIPPRLVKEWVNWHGKELRTVKLLAKISLGVSEKEQWIDYVRELCSKIVNGSDLVFYQRRGELASITVDLMTGLGIKGKGQLLKYLHDQSSGNRDLEAARSAVVAGMGLDDELLDEVFSIWKEHLQHMVPDPGKVTDSKYDHCAFALKSLMQLDKEMYEKILSIWKVVHKRRTNLWKALGNCK